MIDHSSDRVQILLWIEDTKGWIGDFLSFLVAAHFSTTVILTENFDWTIWLGELNENQTISSPMD